MAIDRRTDRLIRRTAMFGSATAAFLLLTADYGLQDHALLHIKKAIESAESSLKTYLFGPQGAQEAEKENPKHDNSK